MKYLFAAALLAAVTIATDELWIDPCTEETYYFEETGVMDPLYDCWVNQEDGAWENHPCIGNVPEDHENWDSWFICMDYVHQQAANSADSADVNIATDKSWIDPCTEEFYYAEETGVMDTLGECWENQEDGAWGNHPCVSFSPEDRHNGNWDDWFMCMDYVHQQAANSADSAAVTSEEWSVSDGEQSDSDSEGRHSDGDERRGGWIDPCTEEWWYADATEDWSLYDGCWENQAGRVWENHPCIGKVPEDEVSGDWDDWYWCMVGVHELAYDAADEMYPAYYMGEGMGATTIAATATLVATMMLI